MKKTICIMDVRERSHALPAYTVIVETWLLFGFIPVWQSQKLMQ